MQKTKLAAKAGYYIHSTYDILPSDPAVCLIIHGFGSSMQSPTAQMMLHAFREKGMGAIAFDFPAHGESEVDGDFLRLPNCMSDISSVEAFVKSVSPGADVCYFGSSFGAYMTLLHISSGASLGRRAFLRSAAVSMPSLFKNRLIENSEAFAQNGYIIDNRYYRPLKLTSALADDFAANDVFSLYKKGSAELCMIHGMADDTASPDDALRFAQQNGADITLIFGGDHQLSTPGAPEKVKNLALSFLCRK